MNFKGQRVLMQLGHCDKVHHVANPAKSLEQIKGLNDPQDFSCLTLDRTEARQKCANSQDVQ